MAGDGDALEHAIRNARAAGDARQLARLSASYVMALGEGPTPAPEAIERAEEVLALGLVDRQAEAVAAARARPALRDVGRHRRAAGSSARAAASCSATSARPSSRRAPPTSRPAIELMAGEPAAAEARLRSDYDALTRDGRALLPADHRRAAREERSTSSNRLEEADELAALTEEIASPDDVEAQAVARAVRARLLAADGATDEARALALAAVELVAQTDAPVLRADVRDRRRGGARRVSRRAGGAARGGAGALRAEAAPARPRPRRGRARGPHAGGLIAGARLSGARPQSC